MTRPIGAAALAAVAASFLAFSAPTADAAAQRPRRVLVFSLGFGRRVWGFRRGDTDYRVSIIPLGGYVSFFGQDPAERSSDPAAFLNQPRWQRVMILLAGPAMNVVLAVLLVAAVYMVGTDLPNQREVSTEIGVIVPDGEMPALRRDGRVLEFLKDQYRHCKTMLLVGASTSLLQNAGIPADETDAGLLMAAAWADGLPQRFIEALAMHRHFDRERDPPLV